MKEYLSIESDSIQRRTTGDSEKLVMKRSQSQVWNSNCRGEKIVKLKDTGNEVVITMDGIDIILDYQAFCEMYEIMTIKMMVDPDMMGDTEIIAKVIDD